ncbi:hypothetical protein ACIGHB_03115 [Streptomyces sp. NPDC085460]|uniref:hypothetical protein n=1 Tax=Streptomyces sp. NPDC085460 TaxID=3365723 RepID=UPI0037D8ADBA
MPEVVIVAAAFSPIDRATCPNASGFTTACAAPRTGGAPADVAITMGQTAQGALR